MSSSEPPPFGIPPESFGVPPVSFGVPPGSFGAQPLGVQPRILDAMPRALRQQADLTGSRELLWPREAAVTAVRWLAAARLGILGGEVYGLHGKARAHFLDEWQSAAWLPGEPWQAFVDAAAEQAIHEIEAVAARRSADEALPGDRYFLAVCTADDYLGDASTA